MKRPEIPEIPEIPDVMTVKFIKEYLQYIREISADDERAHTAEDNIYYAVVQAISKEMCINPVECCKEVMKVEYIEFYRWYS